MHTAPTDENDWTPDALKRRIGNYICRIISFNSGWGIHGRGKRPDGFYGHFFRFDANRMTRMVLACEHLIRCMIIWMALRAYRDDGVQPANYRLSSGGTRGPRAPEPPMDPLFKLRALPLREPRLPPFLISLPEPKSSHGQESAFLSPQATAQAQNARARGEQTHSSRKYKLRPRNDQILDCNMLVERSHRLSKLLEEIDPRARRLAARWAGYLTNSAADIDEEHTTSDRAGAGRLSRRRENEAEQKKQTHETGSVCSPPWKGGAGGGSSFSLNPLKTYWPPPELLTEAAEDEAEDLKELHDVALRATEAFIGLCG